MLDIRARWRDWVASDQPPAPNCKRGPTSNSSRYCAGRAFSDGAVRLHGRRGDTRGAAPAVTDNRGAEVWRGAIHGADPTSVIMLCLVFRIAGVRSLSQPIVLVASTLPA